VVSVVVGVRDAAQVDGNVERYNTPIPPALWTELVARHLLPESTFLNA
jgi:hypothetical protein